jgi:hypothetical protein
MCPAPPRFRNLVEVTHHGGLWNLSRVTRRPKPPEKRQKKIKFSLRSRNFCEILGGVTQILAGIELSNWFFWSRVTPHVDLNEKIQYF